MVIKPSISEVYEAEKNGDIFVISESSTPLTVESQDYISNHSPNYRKKISLEKPLECTDIYLQCFMGVGKTCFLTCFIYS